MHTKGDRKLVRIPGIDVSFSSEGGAHVEKTKTPFENFDENAEWRKYIYRAMERCTHLCSARES